MQFDLNDFKLRRFRKITKQIIDLDGEYQKLSDNQLRDKTASLRKRFADGETLDSLLVEAYATVREADFRVLSMRPFDVQVLGAVVLFFGNVAEMKTGEGKTLTATMPMYLNGLRGPGNFLVTANEYLANRDADEIGKVYEWLGLTVASGVPEDDKTDKKAIYKNDIVYTTNSELGFQYLMDNLVDESSDKAIQRLDYALVDEVDSVLLDLAQTPLIISGAPRVQSNLFTSTDRIVKNLEEDVDFEMSEDTKNVWFTETGIKNIERYLGIKGLIQRKWSDLYRHLVIALRANHLLKKNIDYVIENGEVLLLDAENGRELTGMKLEAGMHQALEAKENVKITAQTRAMASVTLQNFFNMFKRISGMTGTATSATREFMDVYHLPVLKIPTHKPNQRIDHVDEVYVDMEEKLTATLDMIEKAHNIKRPVLIETGSVSLSRLFSRALLSRGIVHNVLNAQSASKEALIVADAGQPGAVTVATSMAGRGTDIKLGPGVAQKGGLLVIGTERMDNKRVDNQLRGRAGRQGDPGESIFLVSLDDKVVIENGPDWVEKERLRLEEDEKEGRRKAGSTISNRRNRRVVNYSQKSADTSSSDGRKQAVKMDDILRIQRGIVYKFRDEILGSQELGNMVLQILQNMLTEYVKRDDLTEAKVIDFITNNINYDFVYNPQKPINLNDRENLKEYLTQVGTDAWKKQQSWIDSDFKKYYLERLSILKALDSAWIEQVDNLQQLKVVVRNRSTGQHNPTYEYEMEAKISFEKMKRLFWRKVLDNIMLSQLSVQVDGSIKVEFP
ncbi:accessory Sec system translocase SecA2 [Pediococcus claussenii]|uniref:Protein translocase subunit SecA n=1 Tax=Pediococcus claussenii (strain ATCC BAA-344 / DSM 14800 / JCM 18046 / KCTC 3811 / LMG 21948 / P06) TaxID=701521 RepID=G8PCC8_PEDCP|nr:accessory Sec system translocase SecA2 [Pediococcus claussenii]AEV94913.1 Protein translocase subunit secA [Pediococcus claussenii ATCC BAA-344]ANZ70109.1 accessory Sec system translocase SecA2 [Pediococcus claussenii]ANZ71924.1 accessory Sec system translocase SecA2 [Pediococcus claussenii]KRN18837.1 secA protein [Pediococcus claussenii]